MYNRGRTYYTCMWIDDEASVLSRGSQVYEYSVSGHNMQTSLADYFICAVVSR